jgi:hypothetical protein
MHLTVYLLMFVGLFRYDDVSKIMVNKSLFKFITRPDGTLEGLLLFIPCSKTDQFWDGAWVAIGATNKTLCPVKLIKQLLSVGGYIQSHSTEDVGPLLRRVRKCGNSYVLFQVTSPMTDPIPSVSYQTLYQSIQNMVHTATGLHTALHGSRTGGASAAAEHGIDSRLVCGLGRWQQGTTFADVYIKMMQGNMHKYFEVTRTIWPF